MTEESVAASQPQSDKDLQAKEISFFDDGPDVRTLIALNPITDRRLRLDLGIKGARLLGVSFRLGNEEHRKKAEKFVSDLGLTIDFTGKLASYQEIVLAGNHYEGWQKTFNEGRAEIVYKVHKLYSVVFNSEIQRLQAFFIVFRENYED